MSLFWLPVLAYALAALVAFVALRRRDAPPDVPDDRLPAVTVVVAARDEAATVAACLGALLAQRYPAGRLDVILADDGSADATGGIAREIAAGSGGRMRVLDVPEAPSGAPEVPFAALTGKACALAFAIPHAAGEVLLFTDADCVPPPGWARALAAPFAADARLGALGGPAFVHPRPRFAAAQTLDLALGTAIGAGASALGWAASAMGNNLAVRRSAYDEAGGFARVGASVTEDHALFRAVAALSGYDARLALRPDLVTVTRAVPTFGALLRQRQRWAAGGLGGGPAVWTLYGLVFTAHLAALVAAATGAWAPLGLKVAADVLVLARAQQGVGRRLPWGAFGLFEIVLFAYVLATPLALLRPVTWKARRYARR